MEKICAVIVTYNKTDELAECVKSIYGQSLRPDKIFIVDNGGRAFDRLKEEGLTDGTEYIATEKNLGGAGGFNIGLKTAFEAGYDWFILMDDDGKPKDEYTFEKLISKAKEKYTSEDKVMYNSLVLCDGNTLSFGLKKILSYEEIKREYPEMVEGYINPFNGTLISKGLVESIGYPDAKFFIKGDEIDYLLRAKESDAAIATVTDSLFLHPSMPDVRQKKVFGKEMFVFIEAPQKEFYNVRNHCYILLNRNKKKEAIIYKYKRIYCALNCRCKKIKTVKAILKGYKAAKRGEFININE